MDKQVSKAVNGGVDTGYKNCQYCPFDYPKSEPRCAHCGRPADFPNVYDAALEEADLELRAQEELSKSSLSAELAAALTDVINHSKVVLCRGTGDVYNLASGTEAILPIRLKHEAHGLRTPVPNDKWSEYKQLTAVRVHPAYGADIHFAVLSPNETGLTYYGECTLVLRDDMIEHRTTFFEENSAKWYRDRATAPQASLPKGYRSSWGNRIKLAIAKLAARIVAKTAKPTDLQTLLLDPAAEDGGDFIEAHIYGPISLRTCAHVIMGAEYMSPKLQRLIEDSFPTVKLTINPAQ